MPARAAFIDRDGVLNADHGYVFRIEDFHWLPGAIDALAALQQAGYALVVVTNQSGIARGLYTPAELDRLTAHIRTDLQRHGVTLAGHYACPHHPDALLPEYRTDCRCRKPQPGMIEQAAHEIGIDLAASCLFGDKASDIEAGRRAGVGRCWLVGSLDAAKAGGADGACRSLFDGVQQLLARDACGHPGQRP
jgi:D-glycero-D-manno-heptose 1,7-bisphosphate phosphatase